MSSYSSSRKATVNRVAAGYQAAVMFTCFHEKFAKNTKWGCVLPRVSCPKQLDTVLWSTTSCRANLFSVHFGIIQLHVAYSSNTALSTISKMANSQNMKTLRRTTSLTWNTVLYYKCLMKDKCLLPAQCDISSEISGSHGDEYEGDCILGCYAV
jgi:hypothetical protein